MPITVRAVFSSVSCHKIGCIWQELRGPSLFQHHNASVGVEEENLRLKSDPILIWVKVKCIAQGPQDQTVSAWQCCLFSSVPQGLRATVWTTSVQEAGVVSSLLEKAVTSNVWTTLNDEGQHWLQPLPTTMPTTMPAITDSLVAK